MLLRMKFEYECRRVCVYGGGGGLHEVPLDLLAVSHANSRLKGWKDTTDEILPV